ncbi:hypothetical protein Ahy_B10g102340 isoform C [Arachis hypogaea]|uniref:TNase-like domain-containing protein n=1 Tax=Arachis hypogaea TaxID=3818 RepID=A0A444X1W6_ARAHY|nr:hypothetical protein Ahy_B10g102340 isoform C [Arachis hypogaea]
MENAGDYDSLESATTLGVSALAHDLLHFGVTSQVPERLSNHVVSPKTDQAKWYRKLLDSCKEAKPLPTTSEEASTLVTHTLRKYQKADVEGLLAFYGLPQPQDEVKSPSITNGVKFEMHTLPVDAKEVEDGDGITVYVSTEDPRESPCVPPNVLTASLRRSEACALRNHAEADAFHREIIDSGYRVLNIQNEEILARKYRIRLRGIDAPESSMRYGKVAKKELRNAVQGKSLRILVYGEDRYGRCVSDVYYNGVFVQVINL